MPLTPFIHTDWKEGGDVEKTFVFICARDSSFVFPSPVLWVENNCKNGTSSDCQNPCCTLEPACKVQTKLTLQAGWPFIQVITQHSWFWLWPAKNLLYIRKYLTSVDLTSRLHCTYNNQLQPVIPAILTGRRCSIFALVFDPCSDPRLEIRDLIVCFSPRFPLPSFSPFRFSLLHLSHIPSVRFRHRIGLDG